MSVKNEKNQQLLENEVVVNENETTAIVEVEKNKKFKVPGKAKKALKVAGIAVAGGFLGYLLGAKASKKNEYYDDSNVIDAEIIIPDEE